MNYLLKEVLLAWIILENLSSVDSFGIQKQCGIFRHQSIHLCMTSTDPAIISQSEFDNQGEENENESDDEFWDLEDLEFEGTSVDFEDEEEEEDWTPDAVKARRKRTPNNLRPAKEVIKEPPKSEVKEGNPLPNRPSPYTEDEEELIEALGGKYAATGKREDGFLGDCTISEIASDYSVPVCYLADVLCMWGAPVPINLNDRLGDLVTGEQAFALVEAVNSLDIGVLQDRYSNMNLLQLCTEFDMDLKEVFEFTLKEGWSLPFGVRTNLRLEQEEELLRKFSSTWRGIN